MHDVLIAGAGPAGSIAALILARAGLQVLIVDRDSFPRDKLCGDTLNPGALALLESLGLDPEWQQEAMPLRGMLVTGPGARVEARYRAPLEGWAISRRVLDSWLLSRAIGAGATFEPGVTVRGAWVTDSHSRRVVRGLEARGRDRAPVRLPARITIAADGRRSATALSVGLLRHPAEPRRWAFGTYADGFPGLSDMGEMHVRAGRYIGIAPMTASRANICVVTGSPEGAASPRDLICRALSAEPELRDRAAAARFDQPVHVIGPLAVDASAAGMPGLLLAGDAAGFVDPMTGDGLNLAMQGAVLAAEAALRVMASGEGTDAACWLASRRRAVLGPKLRFNRLLRGLVESGVGLRIAGCGAAIAPFALRRLVTRAGDAA
jgi:geranylgeranyl reductase family protein